MSPNPIEEAPALPDVFDQALGRPFGGVLGDSVIVKVVNQLVADPYSVYTTHGMASLAEVSVPGVRDALRRLLELNFLLVDVTNSRRPTYRVNPDSKRLIALTFLAYAVLDDNLGAGHFNNSILEYLHGEWRPHPGFRMGLVMPSRDISLESTNNTWIVSGSRPNQIVTTQAWSLSFEADTGSREHLTGPLLPSPPAPSSKRVRS